MSGVLNYVVYLQYNLNLTTTTMVQKRKNIKDIDFTKGFHPWPDMIEFVNTIKGLQKVQSWGAYNWGIYVKNHVLRFTVQGHHHKGHVYIAVNGMDTFNVYYTTNRDNIVDTVEGIYIDEIIDVIDRRVERLESYVR